MTWRISLRDEILCDYMWSFSPSFNTGFPIAAFSVSLDTPSLFMPELTFRQNSGVFSKSFLRKASCDWEKKKTVSSPRNGYVLHAIWLAFSTSVGLNKSYNSTLYKAFLPNALKKYKTALKKLLSVADVSVSFSLGRNWPNVAPKTSIHVR